MERCKLLQANPGKNRWAKRIDFETRHTFIDDLVVSRVGDGGKRLFAFEYLLRLRVETSALSDIQCLSHALNGVVECWNSPARQAITRACFCTTRAVEPTALVDYVAGYAD